jgi:4-nitrophenyl phosphatase/NagD protein
VANLSRIRAFVLDMDGTIYLGKKLLPGARELLGFFRARGIDFLLLSNNSSKHRHLYAEKLMRLGVEVPASRIFTSGEATALYVRCRYPDARIYLVGTPALEEEFVAHGLSLGPASQVGIVVLGFDTTLTYEKLWKLCDLVRKGVPYIATHPDVNCPVEGGFMPDIGATIAFVEASAGRRPDVIIGKPYAPIVEALVSRTGHPVEALCMVGDRLYTDIALGSAGLTTVLVLSGETKTEDLAGSQYKPDYVVRDLAELLIILQGLE